jgi:phage terminase large subunit
VAAVYFSVIDETTKQNLEEIRKWQKDVFYFARTVLSMKPSVPHDELRGKIFTYQVNGQARQAVLFDMEGNLIHPNLKIYKKEMFKNQEPNQFKAYKGTRFTWQQTVILEAYNRAIQTFGKDSYELSKRFISIVSGHGIGKTSILSVISIHFMLSFFGAQGSVSANTETQIKDIFLKEFFIWKKKLPDYIQPNIEQLDDQIRIAGDKDWFLRAAVARPEKPEAVAGLHSEHVILIFDEASGIHDKIFEVAKGALTGENFVQFMISNGTRSEGEFFDSHKPGAQFTQLAFSSRQSPIVKPGFIEKMEQDYPSNGEQHSVEVIVRVDGGFPSTTDMDDKGWIPLFSNVTLRFEPERGQIFGKAIGSLDPAGKGKDTSSCGIRDSVYLKEVFNEAISEPKQLARKSETVMQVYNIEPEDFAVDAFGIGAETVAEIDTKVGHSIRALLVDKAREETKHLYKNLNAELAWEFRKWVLAGGIIITNYPQKWENELSKIKYRRTLNGTIELMPKVEFKKEFGFSPDRFDMAKMTFFKLEPTMSPVLTKEQLEVKENIEFIRRAQASQSTNVDEAMSSM